VTPGSDPGAKQILSRFLLAFRDEAMLNDLTNQDEVENPCSGLLRLA